MVGLEPTILCVPSAALVPTELHPDKMQSPFQDPLREHCDTLLSVISRLEIITDRKGSDLTVAGAPGETRTHKPTDYKSVAPPIAPREHNAASSVGRFPSHSFSYASNRQRAAE